MSKPYKHKPGISPVKKPTAKKIATQQQQTESNQFFSEELLEIHNAENQLQVAWPTIARAATAPMLKELCDDCVTVTNNHVERLEKIIQLQNIAANKKNCAAIAGIISTVKNFSPGADADNLLLIAISKLLHYLMACYDGLAMLATKLQYREINSLLNATFSDLIKLNEKLITISTTSDINEIAA